METWDEIDLEKVASGIKVLGEMLKEYLMQKWGLKDPIEVLEDCIKHGEWFKGIVLSTTFIEGVGKMVLVSHFKGTISEEKINGIRSVERSIIFLYASKIIDQPTYTKMIEVNEYRNDIVHIEPFTEPYLEPKEAERIIRKAISCLEALFKAWVKEKPEEIIKLPPKPKNSINRVSKGRLTQYSIS